MHQVSVPEPRTITRLAYEMLIATAASDGTRADARAGLQWYEMKWAAQDKIAAAQSKQAAPTPDEGRHKSAVEEHGINSPQAEAMRQARRQARLGEVDEPEQPETQLSEIDRLAEQRRAEKAASGDKNTPPG